MPTPEPTPEPTPGIQSTPITPVPPSDPKPTEQLEPAPAIQKTAPPEPKWFDEINEEYRPYAEKYGTQDEFVKGFRELQVMASKKGLVIPDENSSPETIAEYKKSLGVPENADNYEMSIPEELSQYINDEEIAGIKSELHGAELNQRQFEKVVEAMLRSRVGESINTDSAINETQKANELEIAKMWGEQVDSNMGLAQSAADALGLSDILVTKGLNNDPVVLAKLLEISGNFDEATIGTPRMTVKSFAAEQNELFTAIKKSVSGSPEHKRLNKEWLELVARKNGNKV